MDRTVGQIISREWPRNKPGAADEPVPCACSFGPIVSTPTQQLVPNLELPASGDDLLLLGFLQKLGDSLGLILSFIIEEFNRRHEPELEFFRYS